MVTGPVGYEAQEVAGGSSWPSDTGRQVSDEAGPGDMNLAVRPLAEKEGLGL